MDIAIILNSPDKIEHVYENNVIFADGGYNFKNQLKNKNILGVVGDLDSIKKIPKDIRVIKLEKEKNYTDGEYAVRFAVESGATEIVIYGAVGGRLDHVLCNISLLKIAQSLGAHAKIKGDGFSLYLISNEAEFKTKKGSVVSILPYGEKVTVSVSGLYYPLDNLTLSNSDTRGISNVATDNIISIKISSGEALVFIYD